MSAKPQPQRAKPALADDFRLIEGISPVIENRLHGAGILTFEQLAEAQPESLAEVLRPLSGVTARRIVQQGWIHGARTWAKRSKSETAAFELPLPELMNEGFVVDLFLDEKREVQLTQVLHVKSDVGESWEGWDANKLLGFFRQNSQLTELIEIPPPPAPEASLDIQKVKINTKKDGVACRDEPLTANFTIALSRDFRASTLPLSYRAEVRARTADGEHIVLALADGQLEPAADSLQVPIRAGCLAPGLYRIRGSLTITRPRTPSQAPLSSEYSRPGGVLQVI